VYVAAAVIFMAVIFTGCATTEGPAASKTAGALKEVPSAGADENLAEAPESGVLIHEGGRNAILFGKGYVFAVEAPEGWKLDSLTGEDGTAYAALYPEGGSWSTSDAVMYARADAKHPGFGNMQQAISEDIGTFEEESPGVFVKAADKIDTWNGLNAAEVRLFYYTYYDAVAYIEEEKAIAFIVLNTRTNGRFDDSLPAFKKLVGSYYYMGEDLKVTK